MKSPEKILLHLSLIDGIGPVAIGKIISIIHDHAVSWDDLYHFRASDWHRYGFSSASAQKIMYGLADAAVVEKEQELIARYAISWTTILSAEYPPLLKAINAPPTILYWRGVLPTHEQMLAVIGSRKADAYAQRVIDQLVPIFVGAEWTMVSGGALGADSMVHRAALAHNGKTIAIIGSGLLQPYPAQNKKLFDEMVERGGALVSYFPLRTAALPGNFPARNRVIAGCSKGCMVIQAAQQSGASITAQYALEQGREVFAVPGTIDNPLSAGCHQLIQEGAKLVTCADDILVEFGQVPTKQTYEQTAVFTALSRSYEQCNSLQEKIIFLCKEPQQLDDLMEKTQESYATLQTMLFDLQLAGSITQDMIGRWISL